MDDLTFFFIGIQNLKSNTSMKGLLAITLVIYFNSQAGDIFLIRPNGLHSVHPIDNQSHHTDTLHFHFDVLGQSLVDPLSLRYLQPLQNSNFKFKQCLKPTNEGYSEIKGTLFAIFKIIRQKERHNGILLKSKLEELIYLF